MRRTALLLCVLLGAAAVAVAAPERTPPKEGFRNVLVVDFDGAIEPVLTAYAKRQIARAKADGVDCLVLRIDSPGGRVDLTLELGDLLLGLPETIHVVAWIPRQAYSGAAVVSLPCDEIVMGESAHFGDAQPITISAEGIKPVGEKFESPLRAKVRDYAEKNGYPPLLVEAMITADLEVLRVRTSDGTDHFVNGEEFRDADLDAEILPGERKRDLVQVGTPVDGKGRLLTMTAKQAAEYGFLKRKFDGRAHPKDEAELLASLAAKDAKVEKVEMTFSERASRTLLDFSGILGAIVMLALTLLLFQGPGILTWIGGGALALMLAIQVSADQLNGFPIFLLIVGAMLLVAEVYLIPGFGVVGVLGIATMAVGFLFLAAGATIGDTQGLDARTVRLFAWEFVLTTIAGFSLLFLASRWLPTFGYGKRLMLGAPPTHAAGASGAAAALAAGARGIALSPLRPAGTAEFGGRLADVVSEGEFVEAGAPVLVLRTEGPTVFVRPVAPDAGGPS